MKVLLVFSLLFIVHSLSDRWAGVCTSGNYATATPFGIEPVVYNCMLKEEFC